jgi:hypothetical protein
MEAGARHQALDKRRVHEQSRVPAATIHARKLRESVALVRCAERIEYRELYMEHLTVEHA